MTQPAPVEALTAWNGHTLGEEDWLLPLSPAFSRALDGRGSGTGPGTGPTRAALGQPSRIWPHVSPNACARGADSS
ncbi:hypothetical protein ACQEVS_03920 [Streptomyces sp. CA-181903]|uniref:hypothetical protein n=1 Tax=Streptomyces sp. CA-181903 TaxID=3240055 RepID=UPI003D940E68